MKCFLIFSWIFKNNSDKILKSADIEIKICFNQAKTGVIQAKIDLKERNLVSS